MRIDSLPEAGSETCFPDREDATWDSGGRWTSTLLEFHFGLFDDLSNAHTVNVTVLLETG